MIWKFVHTVIYFPSHEVTYLSARLLPVLAGRVDPPPLGVGDEEELQQNL